MASWLRSRWQQSNPPRESPSLEPPSLQARDSSSWAKGCLLRGPHWARRLSPVWTPEPPTPALAFCELSSPERPGVHSQRQLDLTLAQSPEAPVSLKQRRSLRGRAQPSSSSQQRK